MPESARSSVNKMTGSAYFNYSCSFLRYRQTASIRMTIVTISAMTLILMFVIILIVIMMTIRTVVIVVRAMTMDVTLDCWKPPSLFYEETKHLFNVTLLFSNPSPSQQMHKLAWFGHLYVTFFFIFQKQISVYILHRNSVAWGYLQVLMHFLIHLKKKKNSNS